jgi:hypothetical protein
LRQRRDAFDPSSIQMSVASLKIHCPCLDPNSLPPPPNLPSSSYSYHEIHDLYFCEECDSIRCNRCVSVEVSGYYCPNCLFEVPSASVRGEKNRYVAASERVRFSDPALRRCARNCFLCPSCKNTLIVVPSDPPESADGRISSVNTLGDPPFFLYCSHCRWDSAEVGITFEKPTSLASAYRPLPPSSMHMWYRTHLTNAKCKPLQTNSRSTKTPLQTAWNSNASKNTLNHSYVPRPLRLLLHTT